MNAQCVDACPTSIHPEGVFGTSSHSSKWPQHCEQQHGYAQGICGSPLPLGVRRFAPRRAQVVVTRAAAATEQVTRKKVPLELEEGELPLNTFSPKKPFKAKIR